MFNVQMLVDELTTLVEQINQQIDEVTLAAQELNCTSFEIRTPEGTWIMIQLLSAKAETLGALSHLGGGSMA